VGGGVLHGLHVVMVCCGVGWGGAQSLHSPPGAGPMLGRLVAGAGAGSEPASEPEPLPAFGRATPEHCCRGGRSSGYWVPALTFQFFFTTVIYRLGSRQSIAAKNLLAE
jgi:hypothetical protein